MTKEKNDMTNEHNFKVGDKVRIKDSPLVSPDYVGRICEIASVTAGAHITFKDCDSIWNPDVLELVEPYDRRTAFLTRLQSLLREFDATIQAYMSVVDTAGLCIYFADKDVAEADYDQNNIICEITADNIMDFNKEGV